MDQRLEVAARTGDIETLYSLIKEDAYFLEGIDEVPFIDTPLHIAASIGQIYFALEIMRLKPTYARKLNQDGYSPIHVALLNGQTQMVLRLIEMDGDLVRVQGREAKTPLHLAAELGLVDILAEFLSVCPKSIQDLTIRKENMLHIVVKNGKIEALKVILGWLEHVGKDEVLKCTDEQGHTILHRAVAKNQIEMVNLLMGRVDVNAKNLAGLTALDVLEDRGQFADEKLRRRLERGGALKGSSIPSRPTLADSLKTKKMSWLERCVISEYRKKLYVSNEDRKTILVVAVLFATANYEAVLNCTQHFANNPLNDTKYIGEFRWFAYLLINSTAFIASMVEIYIRLPRDCGILQLVLPLVVICNMFLTCFSLGAIFMTTVFIFLFYHAKLSVVLYNFFPTVGYKKSLEIKRCIFRHRSASFPKGDQLV